jgi:hypothetical protein
MVKNAAIVSGPHHTTDDGAFTGFHVSKVGRQGGGRKMSMQLSPASLSQWRDHVGDY